MSGAIARISVALAARGCRGVGRRRPSATIPACGSGRSGRRTSTFTRTREKRRWRGGWPSIVERVRRQFEPVLGRPARPRAGHPRRSDGSLERLGDAVSLRRDRDHRGAAADRVAHRQHDRLARAGLHARIHAHPASRSHARRACRAMRRVFGRVPVAFPNAFLPDLADRGDRDVRREPHDRRRTDSGGRLPRDRRRRRGARPVRADRSRQRRARPTGRAATRRTPTAPTFISTSPTATEPSGWRSWRTRPRGACRSSARALSRRSSAMPVGRVVERLPRRARAGGAAPSQTDARATRLTQHGFIVTRPRRAPSGTIYYGVSNRRRLPGADAAAARTARRGASPGAPAATARRCAATGSSSISSSACDRSRCYSDLYAVRADGGRRAPPDADARAADPDLSPDGRRIVCTVQATGRRALALRRLPAASVAASRGPGRRRESDFNGPRWSPDGRRIVAERRRAGGYELVLVDPRPRARSRRSSRAGRAAGDAVVDARWRDDSLRRRSAGDGRSTSSRVDVASGAVRQVTDTRGGAQFPELAPDGTLIYVGYTPDGYDLFSVPTRRCRLERDEPREPGLASEPPEAENPRTGEPQNPQNPGASEPWNPATYTPVPHAGADLLDADRLESDAGETVVGAGTAMTDALGRHALCGRRRLGGRARAARLARLLRLRPLAADALRQLRRRHRSDSRRRRAQPRVVRRRASCASASVRWSETLLAGFDAETDTVLREPSVACRRRTTARSAIAPRAAGCTTAAGRSATRSARKKDSPSRRRRRRAGRRSARMPTPAPRSSTRAPFTGSSARHTVLAGRVGRRGAAGATSARGACSRPPGPGRRIRRSTSAATPSVCCAASRRRTCSARERPSPTSISAFRSRGSQRGVGAWPIFLHAAPRRRVRRCRPRLGPAFRAADIRTSIGAELSLGRRRAPLPAADARRAAPRGRAIRPPIAAAQRSSGASATRSRAAELADTYTTATDDAEDADQLAESWFRAVA